MSTTRDLMREVTRSYPEIKLADVFATPRSPAVQAKRGSQPKLHGPPRDGTRRRWQVRTTDLIGIAAIVALSIIVGRLTRFGPERESPPAAEEVVAQPTVQDSIPVAATPPEDVTARPQVSQPRVRPASGTPEPTRPSPAVSGGAAGSGSVLLGTRGLAAVLYVDGIAKGTIARLTSWDTPAGRVRLSIRSEGCVPWDTTVVVPRDGQLRIGYRRPSCAP